VIELGKQMRSPWSKSPEDLEIASSIIVGVVEVRAAPLEALVVAYDDDEPL
jgi:hypothetical protein